MEPVAFHEAGHLVAAYEIGLRCIDATIENPSGGGFGFSHGHCRFDPSAPYQDAETEEIENWIFMHLAGPLAQEVVDLDPVLWAGAGQHDVASVHELANRVEIDPLEAEAVIERICGRAKIFVDDPTSWSCIEAVANELVERKILSGYEAYAIIEATRVTAR